MLITQLPHFLKLGAHRYHDRLCNHAISAPVFISHILITVTLSAQTYNLCTFERRYFLYI